MLQKSPKKLDKAGVGEEGCEKKGEDGQTERETKRRDGVLQIPQCITKQDKEKATAFKPPSLADGRSHVQP